MELLTSPRLKGETASYLNNTLRVLHRNDDFAYSILLREETIRLRDL